MAGLGNPQPRYTLLVRARDGIMRLVNVVGIRVPVAHWHMVHGDIASGVCVTPVGAIGVTIFEDEFVTVDTFPRVEAVGGSGGKTTELVEPTQEPTLVV